MSAPVEKVVEQKKGEVTKPPPPMSKPPMSRPPPPMKKTEVRQ